MSTAASPSPVRRVVRGVRRRAVRFSGTPTPLHGASAAPSAGRPSGSPIVTDTVRRRGGRAAWRSAPVCGHVANPGNGHDYSQYETVGDIPIEAAASAPPDRKGREFVHGRDGHATILGRTDLDVLVYSAGRSLDNHAHRGTLPSVRSVAISDVIRLRDDAEFFDSGEPATRRFPVVIASEVIEHFLEPRDGLRAAVRVRGARRAAGLLDERVRRRRPAQAVVHLHARPHLATTRRRHWRCSATANGWLVDLRVPLVATGYGGPRKRYVALHRFAWPSSTSIQAYFQDREYAPSDPPWEDAVAAAH